MAAFIGLAGLSKFGRFESAGERKYYINPGDKTGSFFVEKNMLTTTPFLDNFVGQNELNLLHQTI